MSQDVQSYACGQNIEKVYTEALGHPYHPDHWKCKDCGKVLGSDEFFAAPDGVNGLCKGCYFNQPAMRCGKCNNAIVDEYVPEGNVKYHPDCHASMQQRCHVCQNPITGASKKAKQRYYHPTCFTCTQCGKELDNEYVEHNNKSFCVSCGSKLAQPTAAPSVVLTCAGCGRGVDKSKETHIGLHNKTYHESCFRCSVCQESLAKDRSGNTIKCRQRKDGGIICENCHTTSHATTNPSQSRASDEVSTAPCSKCTRPITDKHITLEGTGEKMHLECFRCDDCNAQLSTSFYGIKGRRLCENCVAKCTACNHTLSGEYADVLGGKYHTSCFRCSKCHKTLDREYFNLNGQPACESCSKA